MRVDPQAFWEAIAKVLFAIGVAATIVSMLVVTYHGFLPYVHRQ